MPSAFRKLDDRVLGDKGKGRARDDDEFKSGHDYTDHSDDPADSDDSARSDDSGREADRQQRGRRGGHGSSGSTGKGLKETLTIVYKVSRLVFLVLAAIVLLGIVFVFVPVNEENVIVRNVLSLSETVAGPFKDVFTVEDPEQNTAANYGLAAGVYFLVSTLITRLPTGGGKKS